MSGNLHLQTPPSLMNMEIKMSFDKISTKAQLLIEITNFPIPCCHTALNFCSSSQANVMRNQEKKAVFKPDFYFYAHDRVQSCQ
jgi:hypothetical protein